MAHDTASRDPESPTTVHPLNFEDDSVLEVASQTGGGTTSGPPSPRTESASPPPPPPPPKPARLNPHQQQEHTLREAFPTLDPAVVRAVLTASGWNMERAFHALLGMTDPNAKEEDEMPPPQPPRPSKADLERQRQLAADEKLARQLAQQYTNQAQPQQQNPHQKRQGAFRSSYNDRHTSQRPRETHLKPNELHDDDHDFFRDDLPVIQDNLKKGFQDTQVKVNSFFNNLMKRFEGEESDDDDDDHRHNNHYDEKGRRPRMDYRRDFDGRNADRDHRYDSDAKVLDGFSALELRDDEDSASRPHLPLRPRQKYSPEMSPRKPGAPHKERRKVSFQEGPPEEITGPKSSPQTPPRPSSLATKGRWQPLQPVDPSPVADLDPFSVGDSDDEKKKNSTANGEDKKSDQETGEVKEVKKAEEVKEDAGIEKGKEAEEDRPCNPKTIHSEDKGSKGHVESETTGVNIEKKEEKKEPAKPVKPEEQFTEEESAVD